LSKEVEGNGTGVCHAIGVLHVFIFKSGWFDSAFVVNKSLDAPLTESR
jgi:hypothetical protein